MILYHFTCTDHGARYISRSHILRPHRHPLLGVELVWLTDLAVPDREGLGLTMNWIACDRTRTRAEVEATEHTIRWGRWAHEHRTPRVVREILESGSMPAHWWVSERPVPVVAITRGPFVAAEVA